jgi:hypothetical protein
VAFPPNAVFGDNVFNIGSNGEMTDLQQLFGSNGRIVSALMHRFDGLPLHRIVYYQSYHQGVLQYLIAAINMTSCQHQTLRIELDPTGNQQDCLSMTPLHILACSTVHNLDVYRLIVEKYPANLITEDRWGALPLLYAFWGDAPAVIIQFLLDSYQSLYPSHVFNWTLMVETMGRHDTPKERIENLLCVKQMHLREQLIDWDHLLDVFAEPSNRNFSGAHFQERMHFLFMCGMLSRVEALAFKLWRDHITNMIHTANFKFGRDNSVVLHEILAKFAYFENELSKMKDVTSILELALWKTRLTVNENIHQEVMYGHQKKVKTDESSVRRECRML